MSSYSEGRQVEYTDGRKSGTLLLDGMQVSLDLMLSQKAEQLCKVEGINYKELEPIQRLFLTHYRCPICKLLPLYHLNLAHPKRVRCNKCGNLISFTSSGKYGRLRKKIAFMLWVSLEWRKSVS
jgi:ribosomal protein S27E